MFRPFIRLLKEYFYKKVWFKQTRYKIGINGKKTESPVLMFYKFQDKDDIVNVKALTKNLQ